MRNFESNECFETFDLQHDLKADHHGDVISDYWVHFFEAGSRLRSGSRFRTVTEI